MNTFYERLMKLISDSEKQDKQIEIDLKLNRNTIYDWRRKKSESYKKHVVKLAEYFGVSTNYLLGDEKKEAPALQELSEEELYIINVFRMADAKAREHILWDAQHIVNDVHSEPVLYSLSEFEQQDLINETEKYLREQLGLQIDNRESAKG